MAMSKSVLGASLWSAVKATTSFNPAIGSADDAKGLATWTAVADSVIQHIIANATVKVDTSALTIGGITAGGATTSNVTGNMTGKVTS